MSFLSFFMFGINFGTKMVANMKIMLIFET